MVYTLYYYTVDGGESALPQQPAVTSCSVTNEAERDQLAECLAFISDMALTGHDVVDTAAATCTSARLVDPVLALHSELPTTSQLQRLATAPADDQDAKVEPTLAGDPDEPVLADDPDPVPEPNEGPSHGAAAGRAHWLRQRLHRLRVQRQRSAPSAPTAARDDTVSVSSHIGQMLNSLDSQVTYTHLQCILSITLSASQLSN